MRHASVVRRALLVGPPWRRGYETDLQPRQGGPKVVGACLPELQRSFCLLKRLLCLGILLTLVLLCKFYFSFSNTSDLGGESVWPILLYYIHIYGTVSAVFVEGGHLTKPKATDVAFDVTPWGYASCVARQNTSTAIIYHVIHVCAMVS